MLELAASLGAGLAVSISVGAAGLPPTTRGAVSSVGRRIDRWWTARDKAARGAGIGWLDARRLALIEIACGLAGGAAAATFTAMPVMALPGAAGAAALARNAVATRARRRQMERQDAVLEAVRMLRQLLETGATSVNQALAVLAERGPMPLRGEFRLIIAKSFGRRQA